MQIPLIPKNLSLTDFNCRDGEIDFHARLVKALSLPSPSPPMEARADWSAIARDARFSLSPAPLQPWTLTDSDWPEAIIRIPLKAGERSKAENLLAGDATRVDAETAERLTAEIGVRVAAEFASMAKDAESAGLFLAPFRVYADIRMPDGGEGFPSAQAVMLPFTSPPHPEFTAVSVTDDTLTVALRFPIRFHALSAIRPGALPSDCGLSIYVSRPMPLPDPKNAEGSIGTVRTASGATARGFRFSAMTAAAIRAAVAAPEEYHLFSDDHTSQKTAPAPDWLHHSPLLSGRRYEYGDSSFVLSPSFGEYPSFPADAFRPAGSGLDPLDWITDWIPSGNGFVPASVPSSWLAASERPEMLMSSLPGCRDIFPGCRRHTVGEGGLLAVAEALRPVSSGQLGEFPVYAFSRCGVWALKADGDAGYMPAQKLGRHRLSAPHLVCPYLTGVAFLTAHGLYGVEGNRIKLLSADFRAGDGEAGDMSMTYDELGDRLVVVSEAGTGYHMFSDSQGASDDESGSSADVADITGLSQIWPSGMDMAYAEAWLRTSGHVYCLMTRPMSLGGDASSCRRAATAAICRMQVCGLPTDGAPVAAILYGTRCGGDWRPLRLFDPRRTTIVRTLPHLRYRLLLTSPAPLPRPLLLRID